MRIPMKAYVARDKDSELYLYFDPPLKDKRRGQWIDKDMPILRVCELFFDEGYFDMSHGITNNQQKWITGPIMKMICSILNCNNSLFSRRSRRFLRIKHKCVSRVAKVKVGKPRRNHFYPLTYAKRLRILRARAELPQWALLLPYESLRGI